MQILLRTLLLFFVLTITSFAEDRWGTNYQAALDQAAKENKYVLLDFTGSDWCSWCKRLEKETFSQPAFKEYAAKNLILVTIDFPQAKEQSTSLKNQNEELQRHYHIEGFPTLILLDSKGQLIKQTSGYLSGGPAGFIRWVDTKEGATKNLNKNE
ncbi:MAG: thioredoxin family protein [Chthoniobacterales bacterium]